MGIVIDIENVSNVTAPSEDTMTKWLNQVLKLAPFDVDNQEIEISIRIVDKPEMQALNLQYRQKDKPTNILSFPNHLPRVILLEMDTVHLGDMIMCAPVIEEEAKTQGKSLEAHWSHMVVHSSLHLLGYDHANQNDAKIMEDLETRLLTELGYPRPYGD